MQNPYGFSPTAFDRISSNDIPPMNLIALRCFVEAARTLNLTAAAERVFLTQPTLSRRIAELENEFGTQLFVRTGRGLELTEKGMQLLHQAQAILNLVEETKRTMKAGDDLTGDLTIDAAEVPAFDEVARALARLRSAHPNVRVHVESTNGERALGDLRSGAAQFALVNAPVDLNGLDYAELRARARWGLWMSDTLERTFPTGVAPDAFRRLPLYVPRHPLIANRLAGWLGFPFDELRICGTYNLINNARRLARTGAVVLGLDVPGLLDASDDVRFVALEPELLTDALLVWPNGRRQNAVEAAFLEALRDEFSAADA